MARVHQIAAAARRRPVDVSRYSGRLAVHLREARERRGLTAPAAAAALGVSRATVYFWESGRHDVPADQFPAIARLYGLTAAEFFPPFGDRPSRAK